MLLGMAFLERFFGIFGELFWHFWRAFFGIFGELFWHCWRAFFGILGGLFCRSCSVSFGNSWMVSFGLGRERFFRVVRVCLLTLLESVLYHKLRVSFSIIEEYRSA
jgi:hypothetical protein